MRFSKREVLILLAIATLFLALRLPGVYSPYHQDEYKWPIIVNLSLTEPGGIPHPPLGEAIYRTTFNLLGSNNFRITPLVFGFANLFLIYFVVRRRYSEKAAQWSALFFTLSYYSVLASLMVDTDGQILPFFFLLSLWFYDSFCLSRDKKKWLWLFFIVFCMLLGVFVKTSFIISIAAIFADFIFSKWKGASKRTIVTYILGFIGSGILIFVALYLAQDIFPGFSLSKIASYSGKFMKGFGDRNFLQIGIQFFKALLYLSPALIILGLSSLYPYRRELRLFHIFIIFGLLFYLVIFDFSEGALDRYLQFLIIPLCIVSGVVVEKYLNYKYTRPPDGQGIMNYALPILIPIIIFSTQFLNHYIPPLYPKTEWISRILSLKWNFLYPFSGGSGPLPFYISFVFMAFVWICSLVLTIGAFIKSNFKKQVLASVLILGVLYNGVFIEEYLFGKINGSARKLVKASTEFIKNNKEISKVIVYNDNGAREIQETGKYARRLYATPQFEKSYRKILPDFNGHVLYINIPKVGDNNFYSNYLNSCKNIYERQDKYIKAIVFNCKK